MSKKDFEIVKVWTENLAPDEMFVKPDKERYHIKVLVRRKGLFRSYLDLCVLCNHMFEDRKGFWKPVVMVGRSNTGFLVSSIDANKFPLRVVSKGIITEAVH